MTLAPDRPFLAAAAPRPDPGSYRDRAGRIVHLDGRIFRTIAPRAAADFAAVRATGLLDQLAADGRLVAWREVDRATCAAVDPAAAAVLEHEPLPYVSYPFEWPFPALKAAALLQLELQLRALDAGVTMADASAYNVQFVGCRPIFIDHLSFRPYREGEVWAGYRQFCEQFLHPLLLQWATGAPYHAWYRGAQEGIGADDLVRLLPWRARWRGRVLANVVMPAKLERSFREDGEARPPAARRMPRKALVRLVAELRDWIAGLEPPRVKTVWRDYAMEHGYSAVEAAAKREAVGRFVAESKPRLLLDVGCNTGDYAVAALEAGAGLVVGFEAAACAAEAGFRRAVESGLRFLPLVLDAANPTPEQGWAQRERMGTGQRQQADAVLALALVHHLAIGRNVPLAQVVDWLVGLAPTGAIEFVPKADPMAHRLLATREDVFDDYSAEAFLAALGTRARVVSNVEVSASGRRLVAYRR